VGGLTVARAILDLLPHESIVYVGDNARFPYGPKPVEEIRRFALEIAEHLVVRGVKLLVVACNSVEVSAIDHIAAAHDLPVVGVIDPGARAAVSATRNGRIGVIGTEATVASGAYERAMIVTGHDSDLFARACPVFVEHVERGDTSSDELLQAARGYLEPLRAEGIDTLILGCTHYPHLSGLIQYVMGPDVVLVSSAEATAKDVYRTLLEMDLHVEEGPAPRHEFLTTGRPEQFQEVAELFLAPESGGLRVSHLSPMGGGEWN
jgi:glutamate racemase